MAESDDPFVGALEATTGQAYLIDPPKEMLRVVLGAATRVEHPPELRVIAPGSVLRSFRESFRAASRAANLVDAGYVSLRSHDDDPGTTMLTGPTEVYLPIAVESVRSIVPVDDGSFREEAYAFCETRWEEASRFSLRTPPLSVVRETLAAEFGEAMESSFETALATVERGEERAFDEVMAVILVAAHHECLHYDLSRWGEDIGFASKATFSRKKNKLEEMGIVGTEKQAVEMGRPRQRLLLTDTYHRKVRDEGIESLIRNFAY